MHWLDIKNRNIFMRHWKIIAFTNFLTDAQIIYPAVYLIALMRAGFKDDHLEWKKEYILFYFSNNSSLGSTDRRSGIANDQPGFRPDSNGVALCSSTGGSIQLHVNPVDPSETNDPPPSYEDTVKTSAFSNAFW